MQRQTPAGIYVRISDDKEGAGLGVTRQEQDCRALADRLGWWVVDVYPDNDISAYDRRKTRPEYRRMLDDIRTGRIQAVATWHTDRLHRQPRELEDFIDLLDEHAISVHAVRGGLLDLSTASGRLMARQFGNIARFESEHKSERIQRKVLELVREGKVSNGGYRPYGYRRIYQGEGPRRKILREEIEPCEADNIRGWVRRVLEGEALRKIVIDANERGIRTSTGGKWSMQGMRYLLISGRIAGWKEHKRKVVGPAVWPAIISAGQHEELRRMLDNRNRFSGGARGVRVHELTGLVFCGRGGCGARLTAGKRSNGSKKYFCPPAEDGGCCRLVIKGDALEEMIGELIFRIAEQEVAGMPLPDHRDEQREQLTKRVANLERKLEALGEAYADDDDADPLEMRRAASAMRAKIEAANDELSKLGTRKEAGADIELLRERWPNLDAGRRHHVIAAFIERIDIAPAKFAGRFDPERVTVTWR